MNLGKVLMSVSGFTMLSRMAGFVRDWLIAHAFGAGTGTDAFFVAFRLPNLLRRLFAEGAFSQAFVPMLVEEQKVSEDEFRAFINKVATALLVVVTVVALIGMLTTPWIIRLTAPGFYADPEKFALTVSLTRWCFPYIIFISMLSLFSAVLQCQKHFALPALAPLFLNLSMIAATLFTLSWWQKPVYALVYAVLLGGFLQWALPAVLVWRRGFMPRPDFAWRTPAVMKMLKNMLPAMLGVASGQINLLLNTVFASFLVVGSVSWLYYADRLMELPVGLLGAAMATIILPSLSRAVIDQSAEQINRLVDWGLRLTMFITLPSALVFWLCGPMLFLCLFNFGQFTAFDAQQSGMALAAYAVGLTALIGQKVLAPVFYAQKNLKTPAWISVGIVIFTQLQNIVWVLMLGLGHVGLALSIALSAWLQFFILFILLYRRGTIKLLPVIRPFVIKQLIALLCLAGFVLWLNPAWDWWMAANTIARTQKMVAILGGGAALYIAAWLMMGLRPKDFSMVD